MRAPALYISGRLEDELHPASSSYSFRLPCPPAWDDRRPTAWAAERRARRAYFATLDALRTGAIDADEATKIDRLLGDLRSQSARLTLRHFQRILAYVSRMAGTPVIPTPAAPLAALVVTAPGTGSTRPDDLRARYRWALEWLDARRFVVGKGLQLEWRTRPVGSSAGPWAAERVTT